MKQIILAIVVIALSCGTVCAKVDYMDTYNMQRAYEEAGKENYTDAISFFDKEIKENPKNGYAHLGKAAIQYEQSHFDEVFNSINKALRLIPKKDKSRTTAAHLLMGQTLLAMTDTVGALAKMDKAISIEPKLTDAYEKRAQLYYELHRYDLSDNDYRKMVELNPGEVLGHMGLGRNAQARGNYDEAINIYSKVISIYPDYSSGYSFRAESYLSKKEYQKAIDDICSALVIDSDHKAYRLMFNFPKDKVDLVATKLKGLSAKEKHTGEYYYYTGQLYAHHKMYDKANESLEVGYGIDARPCFLELLAQNCQKSGQYANALAYIDNALQMTPDDLDQIHIKADILGESGDIDGAIEWWGKYIERTPDFYGGYYRRGWFEDISMQTDAAIEDYKMAVMLEPDYAYGHFGLADMLMRKGEIDPAKEEYAKVIELDSIPNNESCAMYALLALDRKDEAITFMNQVLANDSTDAGNYYDAACFSSRIGDTDTAMDHLKKALELGFRRFYHLRHDDDLEELRKLPDFEAIVSKFENVESDNMSQSNSDPVDDSRPEVAIEIPFTPEGGCASIKCTINELPLTFIFDTGASIVTLSQTEANFMLKNGYLTEQDVVGKGRFVNADGNVSEGTIFNIREVDLGGLKLDNVRASVVRNQKAPLLLGQSVLGRLGKIEIDNKNKKLIIIPNR